ncbi:MAG: methylmalonyl Co-A mutase-associated GTPase MeaB [Acidimicrobiales bacterium]
MTETLADSEAARLLDAARSGERGALARLLTMVERGGAEAHAVARVAAAGAAPGAGYTVGITGAPGAGKSTLTNALVRRMRRDGIELAVLAVDPSSPFTGGAILGDRVRMSDHALDDGVFIRSMATRGHLGGLGLATPGAVRLLHAAGRPWVLIETVGVGQVEVEVAGAADTTVVVVNPGWGDAVQANKAGLLEIADVFVVNKADRPGADDTRRDLDAMLELTEGRDWRPPIVGTVAVDGDGVDELWSAIGDHRSYLEASGELERRREQRRREELAHIVTERLRARADELCGGDAFEAVQARIRRGELDPWSAADELLGVESDPHR